MEVKIDRSPGETVPAGRIDVSSGRIVELDALRGLAAGVVVLFHSSQRRIPCGWAAVDLFFVLSGFLITSLILRHGSSRGFLPTFYVRRALRVWPVYFALVAFLVVLSPLLSRPIQWAGLPYTLTFTQSLPLYWASISPTFSDYFGHGWTLAVEEQFYLLWPPLVLIAGRKRLPLLAVGCLVASSLMRLRGFNITLLAARADGLALGAILAAIFRTEGIETRRKTGLASFFGVSVVVGLATIARTDGFGFLRILERDVARMSWTILGFNLLWFGGVGLIVLGRGHSILAPLRLPRLRRLGEISYGLYLYHLVIILLARDLFTMFGHRGWPLWCEVLTLLGCWAVARLSWNYYETPVLNLKRFFPYKSTPPESETGTRLVPRLGWPALRTNGVLQPQLARRPLNPLVFAERSAPLDAHPHAPQFLRAQRCIHAIGPIHGAFHRDWKRGRS